MIPSEWRQSYHQLNEAKCPIALGGSPRPHTTTNITNLGPDPPFIGFLKRFCSCGENVTKDLKQQKICEDCATRWAPGQLSLNRLVTVNITGLEKAIGNGGNMLKLMPCNTEYLQEQLVGPAALLHQTAGTQTGICSWPASHWG